MNLTSAIPAEGRRARKRRETDDAIALAAVELALQHGYDNVTVEAICDRSDVSRSTFFNYYPSRDAALIGRSVAPRGPAELEAAFSAHPADLVRGVLALALPGIDPTDAQPAILGPRGRLIAEQAEARRQYSIALLGSQRSLTDDTLTWLRTHPEAARLPGRPELEATLAVTAAYAVMYAVTNGWRVSLLNIPDPPAAFARATDQLARVMATTA